MDDAAGPFPSKDDQRHPVGSSIGTKILLMLERFARWATQLGYAVEKKADHLVVGRNALFAFHLALQEPDRSFAYLYVRTTSWDFPGERTDLHHALSLILAAGLRVSVPCSPRLLDHDHPVSGIPGELYGRYISLDQPWASLIADDAQFHNLLTSVHVVHRGMHQALFAGEDLQAASFSHDSEPLLAWSGLVSDWVHAGENVMRASRDVPDWLHFYDPDLGVSVMRCPRAADLLRTLAQSSPPTSLEGPTAQVFVQEGLRNAARRDTVEWVTDTVQLFDDREAPVPTATESENSGAPSTMNQHETLVIPLENWLVAVGQRVVVARRGDFGRRAFRTEHQAVRRRQQLENRYLFPVDPFVWTDQIDGVRFEALARTLLEREPGVLRVRPVGGSNEPDGGRDFICDWVVPDPPSDVNGGGEVAPARRLRVIVQCKSSRRSIGKRDVPDVYDVVRQYRADGYLLVAFPRITVPLLDKLESLDLPLIDWWESHEIESRLRDNRDILARFEDLVRRDESSEEAGHS